MFNVNHYLWLEVHSGGHGGGFANQLGHFLKNVEILLTKDFSEMLMILFPGFFNLANIHPLVVHFPIAFLLAFMLIDLSGSVFKQPAWRAVASWFLYLGTISSLLTVAAGLQAAATVAHSQNVHDILMQHKSYGISVASLCVLLSVWRLLAKAAFGFISNILYLGVTLITCLVLFLGMDLGGLMVYKHGVGVAAVKQAQHDHNHHGHAHSH